MSALSEDLPGGAIGGVVDLEVEKIRCEKSIAALTLKQGLMISDLVKTYWLPKEGDVVEADLGSHVLSGRYEVKQHGFNVESEPELVDGKYTGNFNVVITIYAMGLKIKTRKSLGDKLRVVAEKRFTSKINRSAIFSADEDPDLILRYRK